MLTLLDPPPDDGDVITNRDAPARITEAGEIAIGADTLARAVGLPALAEKIERFEEAFADAMMQGESIIFSQALRDAETEDGDEDPEAIAAHVAQAWREDVQTRLASAVESALEHGIGAALEPLGLRADARADAPHGRALRFVRPLKTDDPRAWSRAARMIFDTINGYGLCVAADTFEDFLLEHGGAVECIANHMHWIAMYSDVWGSSSASTIADDDLSHFDFWV